MCDSAKHRAGHPGKTLGIRVSAARISTLLLSYRAKECLHCGQDVGDDDVDAGRSRMNAVGLVELGVGRNALEEERVERHIEFFRQIRINRIEARGIVSAVIRRRQHAAEHHRDLARLKPLVELQAELERMMQRIGLDPEGRKFIPHVTLARLYDASDRDVADYLSLRGYFPSKAFMAERFVLFSSRASTGGGPYVVEDAYELCA